MTEELKKSIQEQIMKLPIEAQNAIGAFDWVQVSQEIGVNHSLSENEINNLQAETALVLSGLTAPEFYAINIENHVNTTTAEARLISDEATTRIFIPIRNILEENIRKDLKNKNLNWQQNIDFVLSGGDYTHFLENKGGTINK